MVGEFRQNEDQISEKCSKNCRKFGQAASASETAQQELHIIRREAEMLRVDKSLSLSFEDWRRNVDSWIDIDVAEWLANFVLAELKAETVGGKFKYPCLHSAQISRLSRYVEQ